MYIVEAIRAASLPAELALRIDADEARALLDLVTGQLARANRLHLGPMQAADAQLVGVATRLATALAGHRQ
ncbi:MAG: hypothetical protein ACYCST_07115 [Acidimicrobiales bacterium]